MNMTFTASAAGLLCTLMAGPAMAAGLDRSFDPSSGVYYDEGRYQQIVPIPERQERRAFLPEQWGEEDRWMRTAPRQQPETRGLDPSRGIYYDEGRYQQIVPQLAE